VPWRGADPERVLVLRSALATRVAHALLILAGLLIVAYPLTIGATPPIRCRGVAMGPGDTCSKASSAGVQTYEQRARTARQAKPVIVGVGLLVAAFGTALLVAEVRRPRSTPSPTS
jgi:hypothetical protein